MLIRHFIPIALLVPAFLGFLADQTGFVPPAPIMTISGAGMLLLLFQLEDHRLGKFFAQLGHAFWEDAHHHR
jgi:hypothetical protein